MIKAIPQLLPLIEQIAVTPARATWMQKTKSVSAVAA